MHDIWFASKIVVCLKEKMGRIAAPRHAAVNVALGPFTHVSPESLRAAFQVLMEKEEFKNVTLNIKKNRAVIKCKKCGAVKEISEPVTACYECHSDDFDISNCEEFSIQSIEIDGC